MTLQEIKKAVDQGLTVHWSTKTYIVTQDQLGQWYIECTLNNHNIGLTYVDGVTLTQKQEEFFIAEESEQQKSTCSFDLISEINNWNFNLKIGEDHYYGTIDTSIFGREEVQFDEVEDDLYEELQTLVVEAFYNKDTNSGEAKSNTYEIKTELLIICEAFNLGSFIESISHSDEVDGYIQTKFKTSEGQFTHYYRVAK